MQPGCVSPERCLVGVRLATMLADVRTFTGVSPLVDHVGTAEFERSLATLTLERTLVGMHAWMLDQLDALRVSLSTCTYERSFSSMRPKVSGQVALRREVLIAHVARVALAVGWCRPVVHVAEVQSQLSSWVESLWAQTARVRLRHDVHREVIVKVSPPDEGMPTQLTHVRLLRTV